MTSEEETGCARLFYGGNYVDAVVVGIKEIRNVNMNGRHPVVIECTYTDSYGEEHIYKSRYLYSDPGQDLIGKTIPVYIDRMNEEIGFVDVEAVM